jgi:hypothetical protein
MRLWADGNAGPGGRSVALKTGVGCSGVLSKRTGRLLRACSSRFCGFMCGVPVYFAICSLEAVIGVLSTNQVTPSV